MEENRIKETSWLDRPVLDIFPGFTIEKLIFTLIILLTIVSRFAILGERVMSHDEVNHVVPSYNLYKGSGYAHDPVTHGPFQFHMLALSYFLLGDSDFSARVPAALFSIAAVVFVLFGFRRYLGRLGSILSATLLMISPLILYYGRYTRNEAFIELFAVLTFYGVLRYLERKDHFSLYLLAVVTALQFTTKEVAYIYSAQLLLFCGFLFLRDIWQRLPWKSAAERMNALLWLIIGGALALLGLGILKLAPESGSAAFLKAAAFGSVAIGGLIVLVDIIRVVRRFTWKPFKQMASFNLIVFLGALILPQLTAFPVRLLGWDPLDYTPAGSTRTGIVMGVLFVASILIGIWWNRQVFLKAAAAFYLIFITFYTTLFSNGHGFFTGIVGSLGYWLTQQDVQRGGQPFYYYGAILLPLYEFAAIAGTILALYFAIRHRLFWTLPADELHASLQENVNDLGNDDQDLRDAFEIDGSIESDLEEAAGIEIAQGWQDTDALEEIFVLEINADSQDTDPAIDEEWRWQTEQGKKPLPTLIFFLFWFVTALFAYSVAGEKMPWLAVHIALPLTFSAGWGFGFLFEGAPWRKIFSLNGLIALALTISGAYAIGGLSQTLFGANPAFAGKSLEQLKATNLFVFSLIALILVIAVLTKVWKGWGKKAILTSLVIYVSGLLLILEGRTAYQASFINYDYANELLVYAHAAPGPKIVLNQIEEIAARTGQGKAIKVAYDNDALYPYWWYFRDYPNKFYFGEENPTRDLRNYDVIIANTSKDGRLIPIVRNEYHRFETMRLWWPNQDYWNLTPQRVFSNLSNPAMREALFNIWLNRDYSKYAQVTGKTTLTPDTWDPSNRMVVYMRKDLLEKMYLLGDVSILNDSASQDDQTVFEDEKFVEINPVISIGSEGIEAGQFNKPRNVAIAPSGNIYVLDSDNNRVQYFTPAGEFVGMWDAKDRGGFNQPWGIAVNGEDEVFVADTWNHRIMKFSGEGEFLLEWYANDPSEAGKTFYGPRSIAIDSNGKVYVSDTGNKRIMIYDADGKFLNKFGLSGMAAGEFDEPVGIALWQDEILAVADTWNQRVQLFSVAGENPSFAVVGSFPVSAWYSQSLDNKPYLTFDQDGNVLITDPESYLVLQYSRDGRLLRSWNGGGKGIDAFSMPTGITTDSSGAIWVVNTAGSQVNKFVLPPIESAENAAVIEDQPLP